MTKPVGHSGDRIDVSPPSAGALRVLREGVKAHIRAYIHDGGSRHYPTEDAQNEADRWLDALEAVLRRGEADDSSGQAPLPASVSATRGSMA